MGEAATLKPPDPSTRFFFDRFSAPLDRRCSHPCLPTRMIISIGMVSVLRIDGLHPYTLVVSHFTWKLPDFLYPGCKHASSSFSFVPVLNFPVCFELHNLASFSLYMGTQCPVSVMLCGRFWVDCDASIAKHLPGCLFLLTT